jgi:hypothetical protein
LNDSERKEFARLFVSKGDLGQDPAHNCYPPLSMSADMLEPQVNDPFRKMEWKRDYVRRSPERSHYQRRFDFSGTDLAQRMASHQQTLSDLYGALPLNPSTSAIHLC